MSETQEATYSNIRRRVDGSYQIDKTGMPCHIPNEQSFLIGMQAVDWDKEDSWCKIKRAYFYPIIDYVLQVDKDIKKETGK